MPVEFGDLPPGPSGHETWENEAAELRANPGRWARIFTSKTHQGALQFAKYVRDGARVAFRPPGTFDAVARGNDVWIRYIGGES
jgi:hypothetical protein